MRHCKWRSGCQMVAVIDIVVVVLGALGVIIWLSTKGLNGVIAELKDSFGQILGDWSPKQKRFVAGCAWFSIAVPAPYLLLMLGAAIWLMKATRNEEDLLSAWQQAAVWRNINIGLLFWWHVQLLSMGWWITYGVGTFLQIARGCIICRWMGVLNEQMGWIDIDKAIAARDAALEAAREASMMHRGSMAL